MLIELGQDMGTIIILIIISIIIILISIIIILIIIRVILILISIIIIIMVMVQLRMCFDQAQEETLYRSIIANKSTTEFRLVSTVMIIINSPPITTIDYFPLRVEFGYAPVQLLVIVSITIGKVDIDCNQVGSVA